MKVHTQYISDNQGNPVSVILPFEEWQAFNERYKHLTNKFYAVVCVFTNNTGGSILWISL